ncbi:ladderlectin-like isoform X2 [Clupea harengus]|uniref:Ladderlectin-like isoform X2 n=1 Tax=Clupea harengus TaxID=7950 RepID=A0A8M1KGT0_CLUHA|nr:ladderlectin-like isoform X2 [Clupea harengus]
MMKASVLLCLAFAYMTAAAVAAVEETPGEVQNSVPDLTSSVSTEEAQDFGADAPAVMDEVPENGEDEIDAAVRMFCPPGWFRHGSRCYLYVSSQMTWINAEKHCVNQQAALTSVQNPDEYRYLQSLAQVAGKSIAWLGGFYFQGSWLWIDRTGFFYTNWLSPASTTHYQCIFMRSTGGWSNTNCATSLPFFCVRDLNSCN